MVKLWRPIFVGAVFLALPHAAAAQQGSAAQQGATPAAVAAEPQTTEQNLPPAAQRLEADVERAVRRLRIGVQGGVGLDPEILDFGVHAAFGPIFRPQIQFRPGIEFGLGEVTTLFAVNLDVLYSFTGDRADTQWTPYIGGGPNFGLSHRGFETDDGEHVTVNGQSSTVTNRNRFDFSDTDFNAGMNFIVGMQKASGVFFEMRATAWGVSNVRLLAGFNF